MTTLFVAAHDEKTKRTKEPFEQQQRKRMYSKKLRFLKSFIFLLFLSYPPLFIFECFLPFIL